MSLQPRISAPGKARRAASAGKPKRAKKAVAFKEAAPKARHTTAQKAARKGAAAKPLNGKPASTRRYSDVDTSAVSKKEARLVERSKLRAKRYQDQDTDQTKTRRSHSKTFFKLDQTKTHQTGHRPTPTHPRTGHTHTHRPRPRPTNPPDRTHTQG